MIHVPKQMSEGGIKLKTIHWTRSKMLQNFDTLKRQLEFLYQKNKILSENFSTGNKRLQF